MKTIFIDFGNVIGFFDHFRAILQLTAFTDLSAVELERTLYAGKIEDDYEAGKITTAEYVRSAKELGRLRCTDEQFLAAYTDNFWRNDEVCELIPLLKPHFRLVLASNTNEAHYTTYMHQYADVMQHFDALCPSHHAGVRKPHQPYYEYCQQFADAEPGECLFLDDLTRNIVAADSHGWKGLHYQTGDKILDKLRTLGVQLG